MNLSGFDRKKVSRILAGVFVGYVLVSLLIIVIPRIPFGQRITQIYKRYIVPGPFFTASRITETKLLYISWKLNGEWTQPFNPAYTHYQHFFAKWNPTLMYKSRLERSIYEEVFVENKKTDSLGKKPFEWTTSYFQDRYVNTEADSIRLTVIRNSTEHFKTKTDTLQVIAF